MGLLGYVRLRPAIHSPWRFAAAALAALAGIAHLPVLAEHVEQAPYLGVLFVLFIAASLALAAALLRHDGARVWRVAEVLPAAAVVTYLVSRTSGLPQLADDVGRWTEPLGVAAVTMELLLSFLAVVVLGASRPASDGVVAEVGRRRWPAALGALTLLVGAAATTSAATAQASSRDAGAVSSSGAGAMSGMDMSAGAATTSSYWAAVGGAAYHPTGVVRHYYLQAQEVVWDYAPTGRNQITGKPFDEVADTYVKSGPGRVGSRYLKCLYRGYTDATFASPLPVAAPDAYLGFTGPVIRAEVGDTISVVFHNTCHIPASVHPHGVFYTKSSEGAPYADNTSGADKRDDAVPTGGSHTYTWLVPDRAGPGPHDGSSVMWMYHSHTQEIGDTYAGLQGFMVVTAQGMAKPDGSPKDVDREVFALFSVMNENKSPYLTTNVRRYAKKPYSPPDDGDFNESNLMHSINGYVFGNQPMLTLKKGERVRWYVMSMGTEVDLHTPHWHGNDVLVGGMRMDVVSLLPASMVTADMVPDNPGVWQFHCHVNDHLTAGMMTRYQVIAS